MFWREAFRILEDQIRWSAAKVWNRNTRNSALEVVIVVILYIFCILDPDVIRFRHDPLVSISMFYLAIKFQMLNICRAVKLLTVVQQPILKFNKYTVYVYILIISERQSTYFIPPVIFNLCTE